MMASSLRALWNSPSATSWFQQSSQLLRLVLLTPLLITRFRADEIAAWYLLASLMVFQEIVGGRVSLTFSRMISFAMAGAADLSPIRSGESARGDGTPNWEMVARAYSTIGSLNLVLAALTSVSILVLAWLGLPKILEASPQPERVWQAVGLTFCGQLVSFIFQRYQITLQGMNQVALAARWGALFNVLGILLCTIALLAGSGLVGLVIVTQLFSLIGILRTRWLLKTVAGERFGSFSALGFDRQILRWAKEPFAKGIVTSLANGGVIQLGAVVVARYAPTEVSATFLFTHRMLLTLRQFSLVPFSSHLPKMSRLLAEGRSDMLRVMVARRTLVCGLLLVLGGVGLTVAGNPLLKLIGANTSLLPAPQILLYILLLAGQTYQLNNLMVSAMGNEIICFLESIVAAVISLGLLWFWHPENLFLAVLVAMYVPQLVTTNIKPLRVAASRLDISPIRLFAESGLLPLAVAAGALIVALAT